MTLTFFYRILCIKFWGKNYNGAGDFYVPKHKNVFIYFSIKHDSIDSFRLRIPFFKGFSIHLYILWICYRHKAFYLYTIHSFYTRLWWHCHWYSTLDFCTSLKIELEKGDITYLSNKETPFGPGLLNGVLSLSIHGPWSVYSSLNISENTYYFILKICMKLGTRRLKITQLGFWKKTLIRRGLREYECQK